MTDRPPASAPPVPASGPDFSGTDFSGRRVLITGGGSGVGAAMAHRFAAAGAEVVISGRRAAALAAVAAASDSITGHVCDVSDAAAVTGLFDFACADGRAPDIVIANAGIAASAPFDNTDLSLWDQIIAVNLTGPFLTLSEGLRRLKAHAGPGGGGGGRLIAIASMTAKRAYPYISAYAASKHGLLGMVRSAALEVADKGITVNAVCPGYLDTEMTAASVANIAEKTGLSEQQAAAKLHSFSPQKRLFSADEVAQTVLFLASDAAAGINGQALSIDGGETW